MVRGSVRGSATLPIDPMQRAHGSPPPTVGMSEDARGGRDGYPQKSSGGRQAVLYCVHGPYVGVPMGHTFTLLGTAIAAAVLTVAPAVSQQAQKLPSEWTLCLNEGNAYPPDI